MKKQTDKEILFERMHKVSGMPLNEDVNNNNEFITHGTYTVSNSGGYEIMLNNSGDGAKVRDAYGSDNPKTSDWLEIEYIPNDDTGESEPVIDPNGYNIPLNQVMRVNEDDDKVTAAADSEPEETEAWEGGISVDEKEETGGLGEDMSKISPNPFGGTKDAEYRRTIQLFEEIYKNKGLYYALALLYDSQYDREDIKNMMELIHPKK
jgi:hypothetical protein